MAVIPNNCLEQSLFSCTHHLLHARRSRWEETHPLHPLHQTLKSGTVLSAGVAPPGRGGIEETGHGGGPGHLV